MSGLLEIKTIKLPKKKIAKANKLMRYAGGKGVEGMELFAGKQDWNKYQGFETIITKQKSYKFEFFLMYAVNANELHRINEWLYKNRVSIIAQIHSHPNEAYHSETDEQFPILATIGGISIVVPRFASDPFDIHYLAVYSLTAQNTSEKQTMNYVEYIL